MEPVTDHWWQPYPTPESFLDEDVKWGEGLEVFGPPCDAALDRNAILARNSAKHPPGPCSLLPLGTCACPGTAGVKWPPSNAGTAVTLHS